MEPVKTTIRFSKKRRVTDQDANVSDTEAGHASAETVWSTIWYKDGSVVLQAESTQFLVHETLLSQHSQVFREMFSLNPSTETPTERVDDRPLVHLSDTVDSVEHLLTVLYDPIKYCPLLVLV
jgi:hypothetical protein